MGLPQRKINYISEKDYLEGEKISQIKHEYVDGEVYAMSGASKNHQRLIARLVQKIGNHLEDTPCDVFSSDIKVQAESGRNYFYPDVVVSCNREDEEDEYYTRTPRLVIEVLSKSTRKFDKTLKREIYQTIPTVEEYVLIEQDHVEITIFRKSDDWKASYYFLGDEVTFTSIDLTLPVLEIYKRVENQELRDFYEQKLNEDNVDEN